MNAARRAKTSEPLLIALLTLIMILKGVLWSLAFPLWQGPDEDDHYAVIQFIAETGRLPDEGNELLPDEVTLSRELADVGRLPYEPEQRQAFTPYRPAQASEPVGPNEPALRNLPPATRASFELGAVGKLMHATPLYYILAAVPYRLFDDGDLLMRAQIQRLWAVLLTSPLIIVAYLIARLLFPADPAMRLTIPTLVAFHPMISEISAVVSVDGLYVVVYSLLIYLGLRVLRDGFDLRYGLAIGAAFAFGTLIKPTLNGFAPLIALLVFYDWWRTARDPSSATRNPSPTVGFTHHASRFTLHVSRFTDNGLRILKAVAAMALTIAIPLGWWMARSWRLNQDLFYFNPVTKGHRILQNPFYDYAPLQHMIDYYQSVWGGIFVTWWAHFGWLDTPLPPWVYDLLRALTLLAIAGLLLKLFRWWRQVHSNRFSGLSETTKVVTTNSQLAPWLFLALSILLPILLLQFYDLTFWWQYGNGRGLQGRYWLGTVVPMLTFFAAGLLAWLPPRWQPTGHHALRLGTVLLNVVSLLGFILPRYYL